jgi:hypothetical protein
MYCYQHGLGILQSVQHLGYWMENQWIVITFTVVKKNVFSPSKHSDWFWGWPSFLLNGLPPSDKATIVWSEPHASNYCWDEECMELYLHSLIYLQGRVFSSAQQQLYFYYHQYDNEQQQNHTPFWNSFNFQKVLFYNTYLSGLGVYLLLFRKLLAQVNFSNKYF